MKGHKGVPEQITIFIFAILDIAIYVKTTGNK